MNLHIVKDKEAQSDFGYQKIEHYQIFVSESIFKKMLKTECKKPYNWIMMFTQIVSMVISLCNQAFIASSVITFTLGLFIFGSDSPIDTVFTSTMFFEAAQMLLSIFKITFTLSVISILIIRGLMKGRNVFPHTKLAPNNIFTQHIFHKLQLQAIAIEEEKKNEMA